MYISSIKRALRRFSKSERGTVTMETVVMLPFLFVGLVLSYEFFDMYRFKSVREKATYTIADMLSRETNVVTDTYIDNTKILFDTLAGDDGNNQIRTSVVRFHDRDEPQSDEFELRWSEVRGDGDLQPLSQDDVRTAFDLFPNMTNGQDIVMVQTKSLFQPGVSIGMSRDAPVITSAFMSLRFASQLCFTNVCTP
jgi:Flp pilus assembly protein TadG